MRLTTTWDITSDVHASGLLEFQILGSAQPTHVNVGRSVAGAQWLGVTRFTPAVSNLPALSFLLYVLFQLPNAAN